MNFDRDDLLQEKPECNVLLVEDHNASQKLVSILCHRKGLKLKTISDGIEALETLKKEKFDLILMDVELPGLTGYEITRDFRRYEKSALIYTPIVAVTACALVGDKERCLEAGMDDYLSKPINNQEFFNILDRYLDLE